MKSKNGQNYKKDKNPIYFNLDYIFYFIYKNKPLNYLVFNIKQFKSI